MSVDQILESLTEEMWADPETDGLLLYGSRASGQAVPDSDIDLFRVARGAWYCKEVRVVEGVEVDICSMPVELVHAAFAHPSAINGAVGHILEAFVPGRILFDRTGELPGLVARAQEIWAERPPPPSELHLRFGPSYFRNRLKELRRTLAAGDPHSIATILTDGMFDQVLTTYCTSRRRWYPGKVGRMMDLLEREDPEFYALARGYLTAAGPEERIGEIRGMVASLFGPSWESAPSGFKTPPVSVSDYKRTWGLGN